MSPCPSPDTLGRLAHPSSSGSQFSAIEAHVQACPACQGVVERLAALSSACANHEPERLPPRQQPPTIPGFVIERELGRGGMGVVYQAWQPQLARRVAIKVLSTSIRVEAEDRRRWLREAQAIGRVRHRNVVQLYDAGEQDGCLYLVLDLITGGSLAERLTGPLPGRVAVELMAAVARAVEQIHKAGMLHLDIKPANILLDGLPDGPLDQNTPMIADFGIARAGDDPGATATGLIGVRGTPSFMAPEQIAGGRAAIGPRTDVYSLGATLYSLLTGRPPFQAASVIETLDLVRIREPAPPRTLVPGVPRDLETIALTCLRKDPMRRYASAEALADDLERWLDGFPIRARPVSKLEHASRWCRRRPALASLLAVLAFTVVSSLVGLLTLWRRSETERSRAENALARAIASDKATSGAVRDLVDLLTMVVDTPQMLVSERLLESSRVVRDLTAELRQDRGIATTNIVAICGLEREFAKDFWNRGKYSESRTLLTDALELLEGRRSRADDPDVELAYARTLMELGWAARDQQRDDEMLVWLERAAPVLEGLAKRPQNLEVIVSIDESQRAIAGLFARRGLQALRRNVLESHTRRLERLSERAGSDPAIGLLVAMAKTDLAPESSARAGIREAMERLAVNGRLPGRLGWRVATWIAHDLQPYPSDPKSTGKPHGRLNPDVHGRAVFRALESRCEVLAVYPALLPSVAMAVCGIAVGRAVEQRMAGRLDDARWTAASLSTFGKILARRDPKEAMFQIVLCEAFDQEGKNAWKVEDFPTIEAATRNALVAARTALRLDPRNHFARTKVAGLQDKIVGLTMRQPVPQ
jgi:serine/threonine protein kinase